jgi:hypothetical protein
MNNLAVRHYSTCARDENVTIRLPFEGEDEMSHSPNPPHESPFACVMSAIDAGKRESHLANARELFKRVREIRELNDGFGFRLQDEPDLLVKVGEFIQLERLCCPFFGFAIDIEPEGGAVWLKLTGREGVKAFIKAEIGEFLDAPHWT